YRLNIGWRAADHAKDLARSGLLIQRHSQLAVTRLHFVEQPCILDGDDSLIGKSGQQLNLLVGDRTSVRVKVKTPMVTPSRSRTARVVRNPPNSCNSGLAYSGSASTSWN